MAPSSHAYFSRNYPVSQELQQHQCSVCHLPANSTLERHTEAVNAIVAALHVLSEAISLRGPLCLLVYRINGHVRRNLLSSIEPSTCHAHPFANRVPEAKRIFVATSIWWVHLSLRWDHPRSSWCYERSPLALGCGTCFGYLHRDDSSIRQVGYTRQEHLQAKDAI